LLCVAVPLLKCNHIFGIKSAASTFGLQNAMVSTYSGAVIHTTHISGIITDLGIFLGHTLRGHPVDSRRLQLCFLVISGFLVGGIAGAVAFDRLSYSALFIPAALTAITSIAYGTYLLRNRRNAQRSAAALQLHGSTFTEPRAARSSNIASPFCDPRRAGSGRGAWRRINLAKYRVPGPVTPPWAV
jgi:hypothetical protein